MMDLARKHEILDEIIEAVRGMTDEPGKVVQCSFTRPLDSIGEDDIRWGVSAGLADERGYCAGDIVATVKEVENEWREVTVDDIRSGRARFGQVNIQEKPTVFYIQFSTPDDVPATERKCTYTVEETIAEFRIQLHRYRPRVYWDSKFVYGEEKVGSPIRGRIREIVPRSPHDMPAGSATDSRDESTRSAPSWRNLWNLFSS